MKLNPMITTVIFSVITLHSTIGTALTFTEADAQEPPSPNSWQPQTSHHYLIDSPGRLQLTSALAPDSGYRKLKGLRTGGVVLSGFGGVSFFAGLGTIIHSTTVECCSEEDDFDSVDVGMGALARAMAAGVSMTTGFVLLGGSFLFTVPGVVMAVFGDRKLNHYVNEKTKLSVHPAKGPKFKGVSLLSSPSEKEINGLAVKFSF